VLRDAVHVPAHIAAFGWWFEAATLSRFGSHAAPLDGSASTPNLAMGNLSVLISALGDKGDAYTLPPPSAGALSAPPAAVDIVLDCGSELCESLAAANNEVRVCISLCQCVSVCVLVSVC
jgi:hypothetical protein